MTVVCGFSQRFLLRTLVGFVSGPNLTRRIESCSPDGSFTQRDNRALLRREAADGLSLAPLTRDPRLQELASRLALTS